MAITLDSSCLHTLAVTTPEFEMPLTFRHVLKKPSSLHYYHVKKEEFFNNNNFLNNNFIMYLQD